MALTPKQNFMQACLDQLASRLNQDLTRLEKSTGERDNFLEIMEKIVGSSIVKIHSKIVEGFPNSSIDFQETEMYTPEEDADGSKFIVVTLGGGKNMSHAFEHVYMAMAFVDEKGQTTDALVYNPFSDEKFNVGYSNGAFSDISRIRIGNRKDTCDFAIYLNKETADEKEFNKSVALLNDEITQGNPVHMSNACLLDMILVAGGKKDAFIASGITSHELEIIKLFALEAGCTLTDFKSNKPSDKTSSIVMTNSKLHAKILNRLNK